MKRLQSTLGIDHPILAAPMAGGPSSPELVEASIRAWASGFLAGGYTTAGALQEQIERLQKSAPRLGLISSPQTQCPLSSQSTGATPRRCKEKPIALACG